MHNMTYTPSRIHQQSHLWPPYNNTTVKRVDLMLIWWTKNEKKSRKTWGIGQIFPQKYPFPHLVESQFVWRFVWCCLRLQSWQNNVSGVMTCAKIGSKTDRGKKEFHCSKKTERITEAGNFMEIGFGLLKPAHTRRSIQESPFLI